jgi:hypothetical protein
MWDYTVSDQTVSKGIGTDLGRDFEGCMRGRVAPEKAWNCDNKTALNRVKTHVSDNAKGIVRRRQMRTANEVQGHIKASNTYLKYS